MPPNSDSKCYNHYLLKKELKLMINGAMILKCTVFENTLFGERGASFHYGGTTVFNKTMGGTQDAKG
jgi:hypothetical protein